MGTKGEQPLCEIDKVEIENCIELYLDFCLYERRLSSKTVKAYRLDLKQFLDMYDGDDMIAEIRQYVSYISKNYEKPRTVKRKIATLKAFCTYLVQEAILDYHPFTKIRIHTKEPDELKRIIPEEDLKKVFSYLNGHFYEELTMVTIIHLLLATGMRISEITELKVQDIHLEECYIKILGKGKKERIIYLGNDETVELLRYYYENYSSFIQATGYYFINQQGKPISADSVRRKLKSISKSLDLSIDSITPHMFRHTFATKLLDDGVDSIHIQNILGHSSIVTTLQYARSSTRKQKEILTNHNPTKDYSVLRK